MNERAPERTTDNGQRTSPALLTARAAAIRIGVHERTIRRAIRRGELVATKHSGIFHIALPDLERYRVAARGTDDRPATRRVKARVPTAMRFPARTPDDPSDDAIRHLHVMPNNDRRPDELAALPRPLTSLVGRERELDEVRALLLQHRVRLVTLTGPGGVGKTRLAIQVAEDLRPTIGDGIAFIPLAAVRAPELAIPAIFRTLGGRDTGIDPVTERLQHLLGDRELLLLLDNFEHLLPAATAIGGLLAACPRLTVLVTSRAVLRLSGEHEYPVPPLSLAVSGSPTVEAPQSDAVHLFAERARAVRPNFALAAGNGAAVQAICDHLDGLPLAIELAAARVSHLSPRALLDRLNQPGSSRLPLLTGGPHDLPARFQTMRHTIAWSYDLLDEAEQLVFQSLSVFVDGFSLPAAAAVCLLDELAVLEVTSSLVAKSLVRYEGDLASEPRYGMLETIREFGMERLGASGEEEAVRQRHAAWCLAFAEEAGPRVKRPGAARWLERLEGEHANIRAALTRLRDQGDGLRLLRMTGSLWSFWQEHTYFGEGQRWLEMALNLGHEAPAADRLRALTGAGTLAWYQTEVERSLAWHEQALALAREVGDRVAEAFSLSNLGVQAAELGDFERAQVSLEAGLGIARAEGETEAMAIALQNLACLAWLRGELTPSMRLSEEALAVARDNAWGWIMPTILIWYGITIADTGDFERAAAVLDEGLTLGEARGNRGDVLNAWEGLARVGAGTGRLSQATRLLGAVASLREEIAMPRPPSEHAYFEPIRAALQTSLGERQFVVAWEAGRSLSLEEAMAEARAIPSGPLAPAPSPCRDHPAVRLGLTSREIEILRWLVAGESNRAIGERLFISPTTVARHVANIFGKLAVDSRAKAAAYAHRLGLG